VYTKNMALKEDDFVVPAANAQGHSEKVRVRMMPEMWKQISGVVQSGKLPFRSNHNFIRWAIREGLRRCQTLSPIENCRMSIIETMVDIINHHDEQREYAGLFERALSSINRDIADGRAGEARRLATRLYQQIRKMREDDTWKDRYLEKWEREFGELVRSGRVNLGEMEEG